MTDEQDFNDGHILEAMDRLHILMANLEDYVMGHPAVIKADCSISISHAQDHLSEAYQEIGRLTVDD